MSTTMMPTGFTAASFEAFLAERREPAWLVDLRRSAWQKFSELPLPSRKEEEWMRTDIRMFKLDKFARLADSAAATTSPDLANYASTAARLSADVELGGAMTVANSRHVTSFLTDEMAKQGILFGSLDALVVEHGDLLRPYFERKLVDIGADKFAALHAAFWTGGTLLYVPRNVTARLPLHSLSVMAADAATSNFATVDLGKTLVILEDGAQATFLSETAGDDSLALHCGSIELFVGRAARLRYVNLQHWGSGTWHFAHQKATVADDGDLQWTIGALGARLAKVNQHVALAGSHARAQVNGVMFTEGRQHLSYHTLQHHEQPNCKSDLLYKGALQDDSRLVWRGMIRVDKDAQKTDAYQRDDNLMLSDNSRADSIPGLEIEADDVRCTHGATAGRVDEDQIFYARSRGLTRKEAVRMIVSGFFQQVFDRIEIESVREALGLAISRRIREYA
ncbi:MAG: Fe-S cluster assembly protein SufD [Planctomycetia bacterium]|nr:Fe-S cluster assembly protein SufD [Planctomycetia bacterium]